MPRVQLKIPNQEVAKTFPSGSTLLDLVNGGGWALGRSINIVGDQSTGKTLLGIEACANFNKLYGKSNIRYNECEFAFDISYAESIGLPKGLSFIHNRFAEEFSNDLGNFLDERQDNKGPCLYVQDSYDGLSDIEEAERNIEEGAYHTKKARILHEIFRNKTSPMEKCLCTLIVISQTRDKIGVTFGETKTRSGGRALDFFPSQVVWLSEVGKIDRQVSGVKRPVGVKILARNKKNKIGRPFRRAEFQIYFEYGIDDELSMIDWLKTNKLGMANGMLSFPIDKYKDAVTDARLHQDFDALSTFAEELQAATKVRWQEIEDALTPPIRKYR